MTMKARLTQLLLLLIMVSESFGQVRTSPRRDLPKKGMVDVKIYDHRAYHDPKEDYGRGPWHFVGHGFGINYQYQPDMSYQRERGYAYLQGYGRDMCLDDPGNCRQSDPKFFDRIKQFNNGELFYGPKLADPSLRHALGHENHN